MNYFRVLSQDLLERIEENSDNDQETVAAAKI
jgi:hypothetical protein